MPRGRKGSTKTNKEPKTKSTNNTKNTEQKQEDRKEQNIASMASADHIKKLKKELASTVEAVEQLIDVANVQNTTFGVIVIETVDGTREVAPDEIVSIPRDKIATYMKKPMFVKGKLSRVGLQFHEYQPQEWPTDRIQQLENVDIEEFRELIKDVVLKYPWIGKRLYEKCKQFGLTNHAIVVNEILMSL